MKKLMVALLVAALALSCVTVALAESVKVNITGDCNVRSSASLNGKILGSVPEGTTLKGTGKTKTDSRGVDWYGVTYKGKSGWVSSKYAYTTKSSGSSGKYVVGDTGKSNVHTGPGLDYKTLGVLHKGESAKYLNKTSVDDRGVVWYKITWNGRDAWVSSRYTRISGKGKGSSTSTYVVADGGRSNVRSGPGLEYRDIGTMQKGSKAKFLGKTSTDDRGVVWYKISWKGGTDWVSSRYTTLK